MEDKAVYTAKDTEASKLEVFERNEHWQKAIKEFLTAWDEYFEYEMGYKESDAMQVKLCVEGGGLFVRWGGIVDWGDCELTISRKRISPRLWRRCAKSNIRRDVARSHRFDSISFRRWKAQGWFLWFVNLDKLVDIGEAVKLLRKQVLVAEDFCKAREEAQVDASNAHDDRMETFNDYLDGLAELL